MQVYSFTRVFVAGAFVAIAFSIGGCSKTGSRVTVTDAEGNETVMGGKLNAGLTSVSGDFQATISVKYPDGNPAADLPYRLQCPLASSNAVAATGVLSHDGTAVIDGLAAADPPVVYTLAIDGQPLGMVQLGLDRERNRFEFLLPASAGMTAPALALRDIETRETFRLADLRGQIVLLEFYTTDCAPCQSVLSKLNDILGRRSKAWLGKVAVLAVGLDAVQQPNRSAELVAKHLRKRGWQHLRPVVPNEAFSWEPTKRFPFGVSGVPHSFIIGRDGTIVWAGHPSGLDFEGRIEELLMQGVEPDGPANGSQPIRSETNRTSSAAGLGR